MLDGMKYIRIISSLLLCTYTYGQEIKVADVINSIQTGPLVNNRNISFGVKNIVEELVQDRGYYLNENSNDSIVIELIYFGGKRTSTTAAIYNKKATTIEIIALGRYKNKKVKAKGSAKDISTSLIILNEQGNFKQNSVSVALKKLCDELIDKLKL